MKYLRILLIFVPASIILELTHANEIWIFIVSALSILPLAGVMGEATEEIAAYSGPRIGGFLNATFGNATELIIAIFALKAGLFDVVKASVAGSVIGNALLVLGLSILFGGLKHKEQSFNKHMIETSSSMLLFAVIGLSIPAFFMHTVKPDLLNRGNYEAVSVCIAVLMFIIYIAGLYFSFFTHKDLYGTEHEEVVHKKWSLKKAVLILVLTTVAIAFESEFLVGSVEEVTKQFHISELFIGIILIPIIGNAAEHSTAIIMAVKNKMDVAVEIAVGSSLQILLFVAPVLVFLSLLFGKPMSIIFSEYELVSLFAAAIIANKVSIDGRSNWLEGVYLVGVYTIIAVSFLVL